ncbi:hypothetical protein J3459_022526 [Metarhizium acridum]|nr:hypothetical protein J3459_022526 [Metarhizium acridum]
MTKRGEGRQRALEQDDQLQKEGSKTPSRTGSLSLSIGQLATARMAIEPTDGHSRPGKRHRVWSSCVDEAPPPEVPRRIVTTCVPSNPPPRSGQTTKYRMVLSMDTILSIGRH